MWIKFGDEEPEEGRDLWYFFEIVGVHKGQYYGSWTFASDNGFLNGDVTHWQYDTGQEKPLPPKGYHMTDLAKMEIVSEWYKKNHHLFKTDQYYGLDIISELFDLVKTCSQPEGK